MKTHLLKHVKLEEKDKIEIKAFNVILSLFEGRTADDNLLVWRQVRNFLNQCERFDSIRSKENFKDAIFLVNSIILDWLTKDSFDERKFNSIWDSNHFAIADTIIRESVYGDESYPKGMQTILSCLRTIDTEEEMRYWFEEKGNFQSVLFDVKTICNTLKWILRIYPPLKIEVA